MPMRRFSDTELEPQPSKDTVLRAADAVRAFDNSDGWKLFARGMERFTSSATKQALDGHASMMQMTECAYAAGVRQTLREIYRAMNAIITDAERISSENE